jgi:hypothetical protein
VDEVDAVGEVGDEVGDFEVAVLQFAVQPVGIRVSGQEREAGEGAES